MTKNESKEIARKRRAEIYAEFLASGAKNFRQFALNKGDLTTVRYWQILSKAEKEASLSTASQSGSNSIR